MAYHIGRTFVPSSTITRRMAQKDARIDREIRALRARIVNRELEAQLLATATRVNAALAGWLVATQAAPVVDRVVDNVEAVEDFGSRCGTACGWCGMCS